MSNPYNETLIVLLLTLAITLLFDRLIARAVWSATSSAARPPMPDEEPCD